MSVEWTSQPLSIEAIASRFILPVIIRAAPGFRGSTEPIILHSVTRFTFAFGRALRPYASIRTGRQSYRPIPSETVTVPLEYPGYFECLASDRDGGPRGIVPEESIAAIVTRMRTDHRSEAFYLAAPLRAYRLETNKQGVTNRVWQELEAHRVIIFDEIVQTEYIPTDADQLTKKDYAFSWRLCARKRILKRTEDAIKCIVTRNQTYYVPCSATDDVCLIPIGQRGSTNTHKLQTIQNCLEHFALPLNIKLARLPGLHTYEDFDGHLQLLGSRTEELAICASLSSSHVAAIQTNTSLKFIVAPLPISHADTRFILSRCDLFIQSFDTHIRRLVISSFEQVSRRTRSHYSKQSSDSDIKRTLSTDRPLVAKDDPVPATGTDEGYRSESFTKKKHNSSKKQRAISMHAASRSKEQLANGKKSAYNSLVHPGATTTKLKKSSSSLPSSPPVLPDKPAKFAYPLERSVSDGESGLIEKLDAAGADGVLMIDNSNELFRALASDSRLS